MFTLRDLRKESPCTIHYWPPAGNMYGFESISEILKPEHGNKGHSFSKMAELVFIRHPCMKPFLKGNYL